MWSHVHIDESMHINKTAKRLVENLAQTSFRFSPDSFRAHRLSTVDLLALTSLDLARSNIENINYLFTKQTFLIWRSTVPTFPLQ